MAERKKPNRTGVGLGVYIPRPLDAAFTRYVDESRPRTNKTAVVQMLLEQFLKDQGYWPPPDEPPEE